MPVTPLPCDCGGDGGTPCPLGPVSTTGLCLADGTPIAVVHTRDCAAGTVTQEGYINLLTGIFTPGAPPAGTRACGERDFELTNWCDLNPDGSLIAHVLIEYEYDEETGRLIGSRLLDLFGQPYNGGNGPVGVIGSCGTAEQIFQHQEILCDHRTGTPSGGTPGTATMTLGLTPRTSANLPQISGAPRHVADNSYGVSVWDGGSVALPPTIPVLGLGSGTDAGAHVHFAVQLDPGAVADGVVDEAGNVAITATITFTNNGTGSAWDWFGRLALFNAGVPVPGALLEIVSEPPTTFEDPGFTRTVSVTGTVPYAALDAGNIAIGFNLETGADPGGSPPQGTDTKTWTLSNASVTAVADVTIGAGEVPGPVIPFIRKYIEDARGVVLDTVDLTFDGLGYLVQGNVGQCLPEDPEQTFGLQLCDVQPDGTVVPFIRTYTVSCGEIVQSCDKDLGGIDDYDPSGTVQSCDTVSSCSNCETVELCDQLPGIPTDPPLEFSQVPLSTLPDGPTNGVLANGVGYTVSCGHWNTPQNHYTFYQVGSATSPACVQTWTFDQPVYVRFGLRGLNLPSECIEATTGDGSPIDLVSASPNHIVTANPAKACRTAAASSTDESVFVTDQPVTQLILTATGGAGDAGRGPGLIEAALPVDAPFEPGAVVPFLRTICRDCDGNIIGTPTDTLDGVTPYEIQGEVAACDTVTKDCDANTCHTVEICDAGSGTVSRLTAGVNASSGAFSNGTTWTSVAFSGDLSTQSPRASNAGAGSGEGLWWSGCNGFPAESVGPVEWTWSTPEITEFSVAMVYTAGDDVLPLIANTMQLPVGIEPIFLPAGYHWDPVLNRLSVDSTVQGAAACSAVQSPSIAEGARFRTTSPVTKIRLDYLGSRRAGCGQFCPYGYGAFQIGASPTKFLRTICRDCDGEVVSVQNSTFDGNDYSPVGAVGPCPDSCDTIQLCDGYHGEASIVGTFGAGSSSGKMANGVPWTAVGPALAIVGIWGFPADTSLGTETYTFSKAMDWVELDLGVAGSASTPECIRITGFELVPGTLSGSDGTWDPDTQTLCGTNKAGTFRRANVSSFTVQKTSDLGGISGTWKVRASIDLDVPFLRTICRDADGTAVGVPTDTTLDGSTPYLVGGVVGTCLGKDCCQPVQVCIRTTTQGVSDFITNPLQADDGTPESGWTWAPGVSASNPGGPTDPADAPQWFPMYKKSFNGQSGGTWATIDSAPNKAGWIAPHPDARVNNTGAVGEGPSLDETPPGEHWWARSSFTLPAAADPGSVKVQVTVLNADQVALRYRWNDGPWVSGGGNYTSVAPYTTPAQTVPGVVPGANTLYFEVLENANSVTDPGNGAGVKAHFIVTYDLVGVAQRSWTRMVCCDGSEYYLDEDNVRQDSLPDGWMITPCGSSPQPVVLCDDNGSFIRHYYYSGDQVLYRDTDEFGVNYLPVGTVGACTGGGGPVGVAAEIFERCICDDTNGDGVSDVRAIEMWRVPLDGSAPTMIGRYRDGDFTQPYPTVTNPIDCP